MLFGFFFVAEVNAQSDKKYNREMEKAYKKRAKELKKEKWKATGSLTLEAELMRHLRALQDENNTEMITEVTMCKSSGQCREQARNDVINGYAQQAASYVRGRVISDLYNNSASDVPEGFDKFYAAYERLVSTAINNVIKLSFSIEKPNGNGKTYRGYFLISGEKACSAQLRAMKEAADASKLAQKDAESVSKFIQEGFNAKIEPESNE
jgi:hypothetical protein